MIGNEVEVVETTRQRLGPVGLWLAAAQAARHASAPTI